MAQKRNKISDFIANFCYGTALNLTGLFPYRWRPPIMGWIARRILGPISGWNKRIATNLAYVRPDLDAKTIAEIQSQAPDNAGRTLIEIYAGARFKTHLQEMKMHGPGFEAMRAAQTQGKPVIIVSGHFGNYDAVRGALANMGQPVAGLYRPFDNVFFNARYRKTIGEINGPVFPRGRRGLSEMLKFLRQGNTVALLIDQYMHAGEPVDFFGQTARTALSAAEMALKYDALILPAYGVRQPDGISFDIIVEEPIAHTDPVTMTQALNDSLEAQVRDNMGQWLWMHRRWDATKNPT